MGLETATSIAALNALWPLGTDPRSQGDDHLRLIKSVMKADVPSLKNGGAFTSLIEGYDGGEGPDGWTLGQFGGGTFAIARDGTGRLALNQASDMIRFEPAGAAEVIVIRNAANSTNLYTVTPDGAVAQDGGLTIKGGADSTQLGLLGGGAAQLSRSTYGAVKVNQAAAAVVVGGTGSTVLSGYFQARDTGDVTRYAVDAPSGNVRNANNSYAGISDARLKENVEDAGPQLADLLALRVVRFNLIGDALRQVGLIAQEVQAVKPGLVEADAEGFLSVKYSILGPLMLKALQELEARVAGLEAAG